MTALPGDLAPGRAVLHRVAAHLLGRRRYDICGRFGLRASPGGIATPAYGEGPETLRVAGATLCREVVGVSSYAPISGSTLEELARFVGVDLDASFDCGKDAPPVGDAEVPLQLSDEVVGLIGDWYALGWRVLDSVSAPLPPEAEPAVVQLWPEHFDAGTSVGLPSGRRVNLGVSPGDAYEAEPYLYVGPQGPERPGDSSFWNAPFGAVLTWSEVFESSEPARRCREFMLEGLRHAAGD